MIEMLSHLADGTCKNCGEPIGLTVGEWSPETWSHDSNGRPECPGAPVAEPVNGGSPPNPTEATDENASSPIPENARE